MARNTVTFDSACAEWAKNKTIGTAHQLLRVGLVYWNDDMIGDETFGEEVVKPVMQYLGEFKEAVKR